MLTQKSILFWAVLAASMFLGNGCAGFRELFSDPGAEERRAARREQRKKQKKSELKSRRYTRDPLDSLIFSDRTKGEDWSKNSSLTEAEKAALRNSLNPESQATRQAIDQIYRQNEQRRKKRQDDIFGPNPFR